MSLKWPFLVVLIVPALFLGCAHSNYPEYPLVWGHLITAEDHRCVDVSGIYEYRNEEDKCSVGGTLYHITSDVVVTHVEVTQACSDYLEISLWNQKTLVRKERYKRDEDFSCTKTTVNFLPKEEIIGKGHVAGWNYHEKELMKTENGRLVIRSATGEYGLLGFLMPLAEKYTWWCRFKPVSGGS
jgi:hypothetical protein